MKIILEHDEICEALNSYLEKKNIPGFKEAIEVKYSIIGHYGGKTTVEVSFK
jgi:hypothetical protein